MTVLWCIEDHYTIWLPQGMFKLVQEELVLCGFPKSRYCSPVVIKLSYICFLTFILKVNFKKR